MCSSPYCTHSWLSSNTTVTNGIRFSTATITYTDKTWENWTTPSTLTITVQPREIVWDRWVVSTRTNEWGSPLRRRVQRGELPTVEEIDEEDEAVQERRAAQLRRREEQEAAKARAEELLMGCLDEEQRHQLLTRGRFNVRSASGRLYVIERGYAGNVFSGQTRFCIHMDHRLPEADHMLAQKLLIETDEDSFLRIANHSFNAAYAFGNGAAA